MSQSTATRLTVSLLLLSQVIRLHAAEVQDVRMWRAPDHTRLVFDLSAAVDYTLFSLDNPDRLVIDIDTSATSQRFNGLDFTSSPIRAIRSGERDDDTLRIVLDLETAVDPSSFTLAPNSEFGNRLVVDLYDKEPRPNAAVTTGTGNRPASQSDGRREIVVAISAGHGGEDPGSIGYDGRLKEKNITLAISRALFNRLQSMPGYKPVMIREGDYYVELKRRPEIARRSRADLFVAIHADWYRNSRARGVTVYALSGDRADRENSARVSQKENSSDLLGGVGGDLAIGNFDDDVALTLVSLQMAWSMEQSLVAGTRILESLDGITRIRKDKVQQASLQVLNSPDIPSILVETGYLTNPEEAQRLNTRGFQQRLAAAIAQGVMNYFYETPPEGTLVAWQKANGITPGTYTVKRGDNLSEIAERFGLSLAQLKASNSLQSDTIQVGQVLSLPGAAPIPASEHTISRGETLSEIAQLYRISVPELRAANKLSNDRIMVGQILKIPSL